MAKRKQADINQQLRREIGGRKVNTQYCYPTNSSAISR
jgi:hypothetical protein